MSIHIAHPAGEPHELELGSALPPALPILPLKDSVPFPDTLTPLAVGQDRSVRLWDAERERCLAVLKGHTNGGIRVAISADGRTVASGGIDGTVAVKRHRVVESRARAD